MTVSNTFLAALSSHLPITSSERGPILVVPSVEDLHSVIRLANKTKTPLEPDLGQATTRPNAVLLDLSPLNRTLSYRPEEHLITIESGIRIDQLASTLEGQDQRLALTYPGDRSLLSVLGNEQLSLQSTRYGSLRQWVVGIHAITGDGHLIHYGGEVVKNVTGYDMGKLFIGSHHRFGLITSVVLKVLPKPEMTRSFLFHFDELDHALRLSQKLNQLVSSAEMFSVFRTKSTFGWQVLLSLSGLKTVVQTESDRVHQEAQSLNTDLQELFLAPQAVQRWTHKLDWTHPEEPEALVIRVALPQKSLLDFPYRIFSDAELKNADMLIPMHTQQLWLRWVSVHVPPGETLEALKRMVESQQGFIEVMRVPAALLHLMDQYNQETNPVLSRWTTSLKQQYDPHGILMPVPQAPAIGGASPYGA
jgi:FAD/FMN-containing dehydrogenase